MPHGGYPVVRAKSVVAVPHQRQIERDHKVGTLSRVTSVPNLNNLYVDSGSRPSTYYKYRRDWDLLDSYDHDRYTYGSPIYFPEYKYTSRRYTRTDPIPNSLGFEYPSFLSRYKYYSDYLNPQFYSRHRRYRFSDPLNSSWQPFLLDQYNVKKAIKLYKDGIISFDTLDKKWIEPTSLIRRQSNWLSLYEPAGVYGARRYFYSYL